MAKFKVGDWIIYKDTNSPFSEPERTTPRLVVEIQGKYLTYKPGVFSPYGTAHQKHIDLAPKTMNMRKIKAFLGIKDEV